MPSFESEIWKKVKGGYRLLYNPAPILARLNQNISKEEIDSLLDELFENLHHQGDVDIASYLALPKLVQIGMSKPIINWKLLSLCAIIEIERHELRNPKVPQEFENEYSNGLKNLEEFSTETLSTESG